MEYQIYLKQLAAFKAQTSNKSVKCKLSQAIDLIDSLAQHDLPAEISAFNFSEQFIVDHLGDCPQIMDIDQTLADLRQVVIENFGLWHLFSKSWLNDLATFLAGEKTIQLMAGNAVIASFLDNVLAVDQLDWQGQDNQAPNPWTDVEQMDALAAVKKYYLTTQAFILEWAPDFDQEDVKILQFLRDHQWQGDFIVIGEYHGATNSQAFWDLAHLTVPAALNINHPAIDFIDDQVFIAS